MSTEKRFLWSFLLFYCFFSLIACGGKNREEQIMVERDFLGIQANMLFFYYQNPGEAEKFYRDILGLEVVLDYDFAKVLKVSKTLYLGLVDESKGMHRASESKTVTLSTVTAEIDGWYEYLLNRGVLMHSPLSDSSRLPIRGFVALDPEGYFLEFETFLPHPQNEKLLPRLPPDDAVYPSFERQASRPKNLGILANIIWLYYMDLDKAQRFYEDVFGFELLVDQGFAKVYGSSPTAYIGLVDQAHGLHKFSKEKAVTLSFVSEKIDNWYKHLLDNGLEMREALADSETIPVRAFVTYDIAGYFLEFDRFLDDERNAQILSLLK
jgi:catechol 2,3-dioxygenase-like lactoylglutathione lyase family enzyme